MTPKGSSSELVAFFVVCEVAYAFKAIVVGPEALTWAKLVTIASNFEQDAQVSVVLVGLELSQNFFDQNLLRCCEIFAELVGIKVDQACLLSLD